MSSIPRQSREHEQRTQLSFWEHQTRDTASPIPGSHFGTSVGTVVAREVQGPNDPLLEVIYQSLLAPHFSSDDLDSLEALQHYLGSRRGREQRIVKYHVTGAMLDRQVIAATLFASFVGRRFSFMKAEYTAVHPEFRGHGLARWLALRRLSVTDRDARNSGHGAGLDFSVITLNPNSTPANTAIWTGMGYQLIDFPFVQLPLHDAQEPLHGVTLGFMGASPSFLDRTHLTTAEMFEIVHACNYFRFCNTSLAEYDEYHAMLRFLWSEKVVRLL